MDLKNNNIIKKKDQSQTLAIFLINCTGTSLSTMQDSIPIKIKSVILNVIDKNYIIHILFIFICLDSQKFRSSILDIRYLVISIASTSPCQT